MSSKELWVKNNTPNDVGLGDLGMKVPAQKTLELFKYNPQLTVAAVEISKTEGSLFKRVLAGVLSVVKGPVSTKPHGLDRIKVSTEPTQVVRTKSSVFIDTSEEDVLEDSDFGDFADYGLGDLGHTNTEHRADQEGVVVVSQLQDDLTADPVAVKVAVENVGLGKKSAIMDVKPTEPTIPITAHSEADEEFVSIKAPENKVKPPETENAPPQVKKVGKNIVVEKGEGVAVTEPTEEFDYKVATKDKTGATVMRLKTTKKPKPAKSTKGKPAKTKTQKGKKTSKK